MNQLAKDLGEIEHQKTLFFMDIGIPGSGYARYAAAMYFHNLSLLSLELLEIYRRCCKFDFEDPVSLARHEGIVVLAEDDPCWELVQT